MNWFRTWMSVAALASAPAAPAWALVTSDGLGSHVVAPGEVRYGINPDGVVIVGGLKPSGEAASICTGALISDRHVLSAAHCFDSDGNGAVDWEFSLFPHEMVFDLAGGLVAIEYDLTSIKFPDSWLDPDGHGDIAIATLTDDAPADVPRYPLYGGAAEVGRPFVLVAYGDPGYGATGSDDAFDDQPTQRAGRNRYEAIRNDEGTDFLAYDFDSGLERNNALPPLGFNFDLGFGADEVGSASGDSGAPSFIGGAIVAVTAWGETLPDADVNDELDFSWGEIGYDTRVSAFRDFILQATDGAARFVLDGDYNKNGVVDGSDFLLWQRQLGESNFPPADGNSDGIADAADYTIWRDGFGATLPTSGMLTPAAAVPEPSTLALLGSVLARRKRCVV